ncbi:MAG: HAMP domain-containing sensor histidine kinase [Mariprofundaceae bacterium]|nr:HAMP domain-containing sensor histidine kinase [Mariprofundaceae bacterium]
MRLFWKLFLILLLSMSCIAAASSWFSQRWLLESQQFDQRLDRLSALGQSAADLYTDNGPRSLGRWLRRTMQETHARAFLLDAGGFNLLPRPLPPELGRKISQAVGTQRSLRLIRPPLLLSVSPVISSGETFFWVVSSRIPPQMMRENRQQSLLLRLGIALAAILLLSWLLSRMFTRPIRALQGSAVRLGSGDMQTRSDPALAARGDELGELARSFDGMAAQLESLMSSHKQLLRDVSHELRSPLARLSVALELARHAAGDKADEELSRIGLEADRLNLLIGEVLTLARFEQGAIEGEMRPLDLAELLSQVAADAGFEAEASGKQVQVGDLSACTIRGDSLWLSRALDNVLRNAVRHTDAGTAVNVSMNNSGQQVRISVRDHGPGVSPDALPRLFEPFYRADAARSPGSGYGLGLAIARRVVELHGGSIHAGPAPGGGLTIDILLPLARA